MHKSRMGPRPSGFFRVALPVDPGRDPPQGAAMRQQPAVRDPKKVEC